MDEYTSGTISITKVQDSVTTFNDNDTSLMTAAAIADKIEKDKPKSKSGNQVAIWNGRRIQNVPSVNNIANNKKEVILSK